jgi:hypothetical protein
MMDSRSRIRAASRRRQVVYTGIFLVMGSVMAVWCVVQFAGGKFGPGLDGLVGAALSFGACRFFARTEKGLRDDLDET